MTTTHAFRQALHIPWADPDLNEIVAAVIPGAEYSTDWIVAAGTPEAPTDGKQYGRQAAGWTEVTWSSVTGKPATYPPSTHTHPWGEITGIPATFPPAAHGHLQSEITNLVPDLAARVLKTGDYMTGQLTTPQLTVGNGIDSDAYLTLNIGTGAHYGSLVAQVAGTNRWAFNFLGVPSEFGGNSGSDFNLIRCADNGTQIGSALSVIRSTGVVTMLSGASLGGPLVLPGGSSGAVSLQFGGGAGGGMYASGSGSSYVQNFVINGSVKLILDQSQVRANAPVRLTDGTVGVPAISFTNDTDSGLYRAAAGDIRIGVDAGDVVKFLGSDKSATFSGPAVAAFVPTLPAHLTNKAYVDAASGSTISDVPLDGIRYVRKDRAWVEVSIDCGTY